MGCSDPGNAGIRALEMGAISVAQLTATLFGARQTLETIDKICHSLRVTRARMRAKLV
jgi:hypothetical protein